MPTRLAIIVLLAAISLLGTARALPAAPAADAVVRAVLTGFDENPALSTAGTGEFQATVRRDRIEYRLSYRRLEGGPVSASHFHLGRAGVNGGVIAFLCGAEGKPECPPAGVVRGTILPQDILGPAGQGIAEGEFAEVVRAILAGAVYVNVHTPTYRAGEIRGQVVVPGR